VTPFRLGTLANRYSEEHTCSELYEYLETANSLPDDTYDIWRCRIIYLLTPQESVFCISLIPDNPSKGQIVQVIKLKDKEDEYQEFNHDYLAYKVILPKEFADQVFDLSKYEISQTVAHLKPRHLIPILMVALYYLSNDSNLKGLALTLEEDRKQRTYIWLK
jgi:hypothetical protein